LSRISTAVTGTEGVDYLYASRRYAQCADGLVVAWLADEEDVVPGGVKPPCLPVHLRDQRARRVDHREVAAGGLLVLGGRRAVRREDDDRALRHVRRVLDEERPQLPKPRHDVDVVHDVPSYIDRVPTLTRLALAAGDSKTCLAAVRTCRAEAEAESTPARATAAALRCDGLLDGDPARLREAVLHYRTVGPPAELSTTLEDLAAVLAGHGSTEEAKKALDEAVDLYGDVGAKWDIRRAEHRLRGYGVRRGIRGPRPKRAAYGWEALTPTELQIAASVAEGLSTPAIAQRLFLSRRTVQTHISHIMTKLGLRCRVDIAREVLRRRSDP
jgi:DNA-binding CsgD family transcriptional regulator